MQQYANYRNTLRSPALLYLADLLRYRHLCWNLVGSDLRSRFRRSRLGILWAIIQPMSFALVLAYVYGKIFNVDSYWTFTVYVFSGFILWDFFTASINLGVDALVNAEGYLKQGRIPFIVFQLRVPLGAMVTFLMAEMGLVVLMLILGQFPPVGLHLLLVPAFIAAMLAFCIPLTVIFSILGAQFRDIKYVTTIALQALFFVSPVFLDRGFIESPHMVVLRYVNPFVPLAGMFRGPLMYGEYWSTESMILWGVWCAALWLSAIILSFSFGRKIIYAL
ncbi:MAG: ABC transporter permease [Hyphomonadaceae bacterium]